MLSIRQDAITVQVGTDCRVDDVFTQFAEYRCFDVREIGR